MTPYFQTEAVMLWQGDALDTLRALPAESVHCVVTSPPYWGLRDYSRCDCIKIRVREESGIARVPRGGHKPEDGGHGEVHAKPVANPDCPKCRGSGRDELVASAQLGLEKTPEEYVAKMVEIFREVRRVLRADGTCWLNLGDSYAGGGNGGGGSFAQDYQRVAEPGTDKNVQKRTGSRGVAGVLKPKDLIGIPWRVAFALQADRWWLRDDIIWAKPNCMPESVTDRPTRSHEYVFLLTKSERYFYDSAAVKLPAKGPVDDERRLSSAAWGDKSNPDTRRNGLRPSCAKASEGGPRGGGASTITGSPHGRHVLGDALPVGERRQAGDGMNGRRVEGAAAKQRFYAKQRGHSRKHAGFNDLWDAMPKQQQQGANLRDVWWISPAQFAGAHFAVMPATLAALCIKAGCPGGGRCSTRLPGAARPCSSRRI